MCGACSTAQELFAVAVACARRRPSRMRRLLLHTLVADATGTESDYLLASLLGVTDSIDVLKPDGARLILKKRPGEIVRDLKRRVAAADGGASCCGSLELFVQDAPDALENDAVVGADVSVLFLLVSSGITTVHATLDACGSHAAIGTDAVLGGFKCTDGGKPGDVFRSSGFSTACCTARPVGAEFLRDQWAPRLY